MQKLQHLNPNIERIEYADVDLFNYQFAEVDGRTQKQLTLKEGAAWSELYFTNGTSQFAEPTQRNADGPLADQQLELFYPGGDRPDLQPLHHRHFVLRLKYLSQDAFIIGSPENPWIAVASFSTERKGYLIQFSRKEQK